MTALIALPFWQRLLLALGVSFLIAFCSTPLVSKMAYTMGAIDVPKDNRRMHDHPIPRLGGLAIALGFLLSTFLFESLDRQMQGILLGSIVILVLGVLDDCLTLPAMPKFIVQIVSATIVVMHGCTIQYITNPFSSVPGACFDLGVFAAPITVLWIVTMTNAVNFIDGLDGLAVGVSGISSAIMLVIALLVSEEHVAVILAALLGACIGFIPFNFNPAKIFMGDTGATFLGFILASISIQVL